MSGWKTLHAVRLGAFALGYGLTGALTGGTLNRIMVVELGLPVSLVGLFFAAPLFVSPLRAWLGYHTDAHPIGGLRRAPYILLGSALAGVGVILAILLLLVSGANAVVLALGVMLAFLIHEFGRNLCHNSFQALLADRFTDHARARAMTLFEIVTLLGLIIGAGGIGGALRVYTPERLVALTVIIAVITFALSLLAAVRNEPRDASTAHAVQQAASTPFLTILRRAIIADPQVRLFFVLVTLVVMGTLAQDVLLEPYGGVVLNMDVAATTRLTVFWGLGVMAAMVLSGVYLIRQFGQVAILRVGIIVSIFAFGGIITTGLMQQVAGFQALVVMMGLGTGLAGAGLLTSIVHFTTRIRAGLLLGVWGFAMILGRSLGSLFAGVAVDALTWTGIASQPTAYMIVFVLEALLLVVALVMTARIRVSSTRVAEEERALLQSEAAVGAAALS
jgi:BCD family chlorophyll transporter-like MFS transporter